MRLFLLTLNQLGLLQGHGEAILTLRELWTEQWSGAVDEDTYPRPTPPAIVACEMEAERARSLKDALPHHQDRTFHADSFLLHPSYKAGDRATVLYLNPPYDQDPDYGRVEHRFLVRFTRMLHEGAGALLFLVPVHALAASPFEVRYPETLGGELVAEAKRFPATWKTPKERWLLAELASRIDAGEKVLVFLRHTGTPHLPQRLLKLIEEVTPRVAWLDASKVTTAKRQTWIDRHVVEAGTQVLLVNPNAVRTGLNNLVTFSTGIWHQLDWSAQTYRQANGRFHRIGQTRPVSILIPYYHDTAQEVAFDLVARKVGASLQVDGLDLQAALEAAGASDDHTTAMATAMSLGQAVYKALTGGGPKRRENRPVGKPAPRPAPESPPRPAPGFPPMRPAKSEPVQLSLL